jgi:hypothetical protein
MPGRPVGRPAHPFGQQAVRPRLEPGERHRAGYRPPRRRDLLNGELDPGEVSFPAGLQPGYGLKNEVVEPFCPGAVQRHVWRRENPAQPASVTVTSPDPGGALRAALVAGLHNP